MTPDDPDAPLVAHLLRRAGWGPAPGEVESFDGYDAALDAVLAGAFDDGVEMPDTVDNDTQPAVVWWLRRLRRSPNPLHDKLVMFWHGHLTSSADKASADMMVGQHNLLRRHAAGNVRTLLHAIVTDAAMLMFLDGSGSTAESPNENLARELMELFTLGRGNYTEADVRAAARALAGYSVDWDSEAVGFNEDVAATEELTILGTTGTFDAAGVVDLLCEQPACARFIATALYRYFAGGQPGDETVDELGAVLRDADFEVLPVVTAIFRHDDFTQQRMNRTRFPLEWFVAAHLALDREVDDESIWSLGDLGQLPLYPPNVAGWPAGPQWANSGRHLLKASMVVDTIWDESTVGFGAEPGERVRNSLRHCGIYEPSATTLAALEDVATQFAPDDGGDRLLLALALASPEASCA